MTQKPPQRISAPAQTSKPATFIFLHGLGDDADGWTNIAEQFHSAKKLPHLSWIFPNAPLNQEAMQTAWYTPTSFSPIPVGRSSATEENESEGFDEHAESEILESVEYLCTLIDGEISRGVKPERIIIGGFSQGCAISLVAALASRWQGRIGGMVGLSGYLPRGGKIREGRRGYVKGGKEGVEEVEEQKGMGMKTFLAHGTKDMLVPMRVFRDTKMRVEGTVGESMVESHEYEGLGHVTSGVEFRDMCLFLEKILPE
ncbi:Acyl-thioesterase 1 [Hyphodiscus hymeniophilus]|uniref:Acyl-protein thioesterase 1 n=1 Tax=Hyphodiscus hymeniophilus TaxID=353542 RepID=A0A9P6VMQ5_9HELO|nr:Acyl-thioesterase 1 [Hyphodiscus hymeniophilus]